MALINYATREINAKIVYYGPGLSGKTTNIHYVFKRVKPDNKGKLISLATQGDRTLFFDFLPVEFGNIKGFKTRFHLYTVPGQVFYNSTRKMVLKGSDGVVFVADSQKMMMEENLQSLENLKTNLREMGLDFSKFPVVLQYNKRDLPNAAPVEEMNGFLNPSDLPYFEASALSGDGVLKTLTAVVKFVLHDLKETPDMHNIDIAAIEEATGLSSEGRSPLFADEADKPAAQPAAKPAAAASATAAAAPVKPEQSKQTVQPKQAAPARPAKPADRREEITQPAMIDAARPPLIKKPVTAVEPDKAAAPPVRPAPAPVVRPRAAAPAASAPPPEAETVEVSTAYGEDAAGEVELPEASPEIFGAFDATGGGTKEEEDVYEAAELLDGLGDMIGEPEAVSQKDAPALREEEPELSSTDIETFSELTSYDTFPPTNAKTLGDLLEEYPQNAPDPVNIAYSIEEGAEDAGGFEIPEEFHPDVKSDLIEGLDLPASGKPAVPELSAKTVPDIKPNDKRKKEPASKGLKIRKTFKVPVKLTTKTGSVREVVLNLDVDLGVLGDIDAVETVEILEPAKPEAGTTDKETHHKDQSKHPPPVPAPPEKRPAQAVNELPALRVHKKKGMLEKMFGR